MVDQKLKIEYPFVENTFTTKDGYKLNYVDEGSKNKKTLIMVHGNPTWSFYYRNLVKKFSKDFRVIVPDHIGCGLSDKPQDYDYSLKNHVNNLKDLIESLDIKKASLIVHDWGGAIGFGLQRHLPDLIESVTILNTAAFADVNIPKRIDLLRKSSLGEFFIRRFNAFAWPATFMTVNKKLPKTVKEGYLYPYNNYKNRIATAKFVKDIPMSKSHPTFKELSEVEKSLKDIKCPKLILWGKSDFCFNLHFYKRWKDIYPEAKAKLFNAGHYVLEDAKEECENEIENFLGKVYA